MADVTHPYALHFSLDKKEVTLELKYKRCLCITEIIDGIFGDYLKSNLTA